MAWLFERRNLRWPDLIWAALPLGLAALGASIGGSLGAAIGGGFGIAAFSANVAIMGRAFDPMWKYFFSGAVMLVAAVGFLVIAKVSGFNVAFTFTPGSLADLAVDLQLKNSPVFATVKKVDPPAYQKIRDVIVADVMQHKSAAEIQASLRAPLGNELRRYLPVASDAAVLQFTRVTVAELDQLRVKGPDSCFFFINPQAGSPVDVRTLVTPDVLRADDQAGSAVIETGASAPVAVPARADIAANLDQVLKSLVALYGRPDVIALSKPGALDHVRYCAIIVDLYKNTLALPPPQAAQLLRFLFAQRPAA